MFYKPSWVKTNWFAHTDEATIVKQKNFCGIKQNYCFMKGKIKEYK